MAMLCYSLEMRSWLVKNTILYRYNVMVVPLPRSAVSISLNIMTMTRLIVAWSHKLAGRIQCNSIIIYRVIQQAFSTSIPIFFFNKQAVILNRVLGILKI